MRPAVLTTQPGGAGSARELLAFHRAFGQFGQPVSADQPLHLAFLTVEFAACRRGATALRSFLAQGFCIICRQKIIAASAHQADVFSRSNRTKLLDLIRRKLTEERDNRST